MHLGSLCTGDIKRRRKAAPQPGPTTAGKSKKGLGQSTNIKFISRQEENADTSKSLALRKKHSYKQLLNHLQFGVRIYCVFLVQTFQVVSQQNICHTPAQMQDFV